MTPLKLELSGFGCFKEMTEVSFEDLSLFAISGPTGSGKSTILDALTFALYGQTARLGGKLGDSLLSPEVHQMSVQFSFRNGAGTYRATRISERKPNGKTTHQARVEVNSAGKWSQIPETEKIKEANEKLQSLVGLDYDGFTRAVMLPQGAFDEFLRGDASKRRKLLVKLLGLDKIEAMRQDAGQRAKAAQIKQQQLSERLEQDYAGATPDKLRDLKNQLADLEVRKTALAKEQKSLADELKALDEVESLLDEKQKLESKLEQLKRQADEIGTSKASLENAKKASLLLPQLSSLEAIQKKLKASSEEQQTLGTKLEAAQTSYEQMQRELMSAQETLEQRQPDIDTQLESLASVLPLMAQLKQRGGDLSLARHVQDDVAYSDDAWDSLQTLQAQLPALRRAHNDAAAAEKALTKAEMTLKKLEQDITNLEAEVEGLIKAGKEASKKSAEAAEAYQRVMLENQAVALRQHLHEGDNCPVCQQVITSLPTSSEANQVLEKLEQEKLKAAERLEEFRSSYSETNARLKDAQTKRLAERKAELEGAQEQLEQKQTLLSDLQQSFASLHTTEVRGDITAIEDAITTTRTHLLASLAADISRRTQGLDPQAAQAKLKRERLALENAVKKAQTAAQSAQTAQEKLSTQSEMLMARVQELSEEQSSAQTQLEGSLARSGFVSVEALRDAALGEAQLAALEGRINQYEQDKALSERREVELQAKLAGRSLDRAQYEAQTTKLTEISTELEQIQLDLGSSSNEKTRLEQQLAKAKDIREQLQSLASEFDTFRQLSLDLKSNEFQDYLMARVQADLAIRASQIVREVTDGRYDLRLFESDYHVLDAWNTGELRNAKTLSGGETFIASLALALALSDTIAGNTALGALFLDEGFGTLDAETLDSVAGVLETLTETGRMVGIITHVTALTERMPARLLVQKGTDGSKVMWDA